MKQGNNPMERIKEAKPGLAMLDEIEQLAVQHEGWETIDPGDRERLKWIGTFFRKPTPGFFMMRIRITNGRATSVQLRALAEISRRLGNGILDITTRQQVELRAIRVKNVPEILQLLKGVDLTSLQTGLDNIRNVNTCPMAGLTPNELFDASAVGKEFETIFLGNPDFTNLPRKCNVTITGCRENCTHTETQDIGMTPAVRADGTRGFNVSVGGKMGSGGMTVATPLDVFVRPEVAPRLAAEIILLFRDEGAREKRNEVRLAFLINDWGIERFREVLESRWGKPLERAAKDVRFPTHTDHMGVQPQKQPGLFAVGISIPTGRVTTEHLEDLARLADTYGSGHVRLTVNQSAILVDVPASRLKALLAEPLLQQFALDPHPFMRGLVTCVGTDYCNLGLIETKGIGKKTAESMVAKFPVAQKLTMHWSGCPAGCGNHQAADIGFQGAKARLNGEIVDAVAIYVGGRTGTSPKPGVKIMELVPVSMLDDMLPVIIKNLETLKKIEPGIGAEDRIVMVPAIPGVEALEEVAA